MSTRFGEVADLYDAVRPNPPAEVANIVLEYSGTPTHAVEVGAGTGKATALFAGRGFPITCIEPDPRMSAVLLRRLPEVVIETASFEDWRPPLGGVPLLYAAGSWHWLTPVTRSRHAESALSPGGTLALIGTWTTYTDPALRTTMDDVVTVNHHRPPMAEWAVAELREQTGLTDIEVRRSEQIVRFDADRFVALHKTAGWFRVLLEHEQRLQLAKLKAIAAEYSGHLDLTIRTTLILARRCPSPI